MKRVVLTLPTGRELDELVNDPPTWLSELLHELAFGSEGIGLRYCVYVDECMYRCIDLSSLLLAICVLHKI